MMSGAGSSLEGSHLWASKGVVVTVLGLAEFVEKEDHGLKSQDQHDTTDEAGGIESVLVGFRGRGDSRGARVGSSCGKRQWR